MGAQITVENWESIRIWRLTITNTRNFFGSRDEGRLTLYSSPRLTTEPDK